MVRVLDHPVIAVADILEGRRIEIRRCEPVSAVHYHEAVIRELFGIEARVSAASAIPASTVNHKNRRLRSRIVRHINIAVKMNAILFYIGHVRPELPVMAYRDWETDRKSVV